MDHRDFVNNRNSISSKCKILYLIIRIREVENLRILDDDNVSIIYQKSVANSCSECVSDKV